MSQTVVEASHCDKRALIRILSNKSILAIDKTLKNMLFGTAYIESYVKQVDGKKKRRS